MMRKWLLVLLLLITTAACAEDAFVYTGKVHDGLPEVTISVSSLGETDPDADGPITLSVKVSMTGHARQEMTVQSLERPGVDRVASLAMLEDANFDGYADLWLLRAQGARNVFWRVALWDTEESCFQDWLPMEWCNPMFDAEKRQVLSSVADGYAYREDILYGMEGPYSFVKKAVCEVYPAGDGMIGETVRLYATGMIRCWDQQYPQEWYYGQEDVWQERRRAIREVIQGRAGWDATYMQVANVDWVNLRQMDSKASPSLAKLDAGTQVLLLEEGIGQDKGWVRVWYMPEDGRGIFVQREDDGSAGLTGYIWHSFLERVD